MTEHIGRCHTVTQVRRARASTFTARKRQRFFDSLALTCNVATAAAHAGVRLSTVYRHREHDAAFRAQWQAALECGCDRLEALLLEHGGAGEAPAPIDPERAAAEAPALAAFDFDRALKVLTYWRNKRSVRTPRSPAGAGTREDTNAAIVKALAIVRKRLAGRSDGTAPRDDA